MTPSLRDDTRDPPSIAADRAAVLEAAAALSDAERCELAAQFYRELVARHPRLRAFFADFDLGRQAQKLSSALQVLMRFAHDRQQLGREVIRLGMAHSRRGISYAEYAIFATVLANVLARRQSAVPFERAQQIWLEELTAIVEIMLIASDA
jgi:hemoglobin-like flavoprotein